MLLERLEGLYGQVIDEATVATRSYIAELGARAAIEDRRGLPKPDQGQPLEGAPQAFDAVRVETGGAE